jgi:hypothetical protein
MGSQRSGTSDGTTLSVLAAIVLASGCGYVAWRAFGSLPWHRAVSIFATPPFSEILSHDVLLARVKRDWGELVQLLVGQPDLTWGTSSSTSLRWAWYCTSRSLWQRKNWTVWDQSYAIFAMVAASSLLASSVFVILFSNDTVMALTDFSPSRRSCYFRRWVRRSAERLDIGGPACWSKNVEGGQEQSQPLPHRSP